MDVSILPNGIYLLEIRQVSEKIMKKIIVQHKKLTAMKNTLLVIYVLFSVLSCSSNDENNNNPLIGSWSLVKLESGFSETLNFESGEIIWDFQQNGTLSVLVTGSIANSQIVSSGNHSYSVAGDDVIIDNQRFDFHFENSLLIISDSPEADGFRAEFVKNQ